MVKERLDRLVGKDVRLSYGDKSPFLPVLISGINIPHRSSPGENSWTRSPNPLWRQELRKAPYPCYILSGGGKDAGAVPIKRAILWSVGPLLRGSPAALFRKPRRSPSASVFTGQDMVVIRQDEPIQSASGTSLASASAGLPSWITPSLIRRTLDVWQPYYSQTLTQDDAVSILQNTRRLISILEPAHDRQAPNREPQDP